MTVYSDQIWLKSQCRLLEDRAIRSLSLAGGDVVLVDAVDTSKPRTKLVTDNLVQQPHIALYPEFWGTYSYQPSYQVRQPVRMFNCFMNRVCTTRQSWFYQLVRRNLLWHGNVSFLLDAREEPRGIALYQQNFQGYEIFEHEHNLMKDRVPFCNFQGDLDQAVVDSHVSLVIETYFDWPGTIAYSEKIFRALQLPRPVLLFAMPGAVAGLRDHGFDLWDDIIDHSYDSEPDQIKRQVAILDQLCEWRNREFTASQLNEFEQRAQHNQQRLQQLRDRWPDRLKNVISQLQC